VFPVTGEPWGLLKEYIPAQTAWDAIESHAADLHKSRALAAARLAVTQALSAPSPDLIHLGARMERAMALLGLPMIGGTCGLLNSDLLTYNYSMYDVDPLGAIHLVHTDQAKYVERCGQCHVAIYKVIPKGYICPCCKGVYQMVC
jgi:hypothetical protein